MCQTEKTTVKENIKNSSLLVLAARTVSKVAPSTPSELELFHSKNALVSHFPFTLFN